MSNNKLPFGLCKEYGINLPKGATPKDAWEALKKYGVIDGLGNIIYKTNTPYEIILSHEKVRIPLDFFGVKARKKETHDCTEIPSIPTKAYGFLNKERLHTSHHVRHAEEMGYKNQTEYESAAIDFWENGEGELYYSRPRNTFYKYNLKTCKKVAVSLDGTIHTFMLEKKKLFDRKMVWEKYEKVED